MPIRTGERSPRPGRESPRSAPRREGRSRGGVGGALLLPLPQVVRGAAPPNSSKLHQ